jgi:hypothetical protein
MHTGRDPIDVVPFTWIPVELFDPVGRALEALEPKGMFIPRPPASLRVKEETGLVVHRDVIVEVLCERELTVELQTAMSACAS